MGCLNTPPGAYSDALALERTSDGGYVLAGGTLGCGLGSVFPSLSGIQCGLIEKVDSAGRVIWAQVYSASLTSTAITQIKSTTDGGFVAVGSASDLNHEPGALILKLDAQGDLQWQRQLGRSGTSWALFNDVQQTADGGFIAAGELNDGSNSSTGLPLVSVLVAKLDANGTLTWQHAFNDIGPGGVTATEHSQAIVQTSDGGYAVGGNWSDSTFPGECCEGALLLKLTPDGSIESQTAYTGGVHCFDNQCDTLGGDIYSLHQTADGGYVLVGDANLRLLDNSPLVPYLAKVDGSGALVAGTGLPGESEHRPTAQRVLRLVDDHGDRPVGGWLDRQLRERSQRTLRRSDRPERQRRQLLTDHQGSALSMTNPGLTQFAPDLASSMTFTSVAPSPVQTKTATATATAPQC